jgi:hypothetical protein
MRPHQLPEDLKTSSRRAAGGLDLRINFQGREDVNDGTRSKWAPLSRWRPGNNVFQMLHGLSRAKASDVGSLQFSEWYNISEVQERVVGLQRTYHGHV